MGELHGYLLTWTTSGTWLHGDERGSKDRGHNRYGDPIAPPDAGLNRYRRFQLNDAQFLLDQPSKRRAVHDAIVQTCSLRDWEVKALNVRTNHVHLVVCAQQPPEQVLSSLKAWATKALVTEGLAAPGTRVWTRHGSTRYLWSEDDVLQASLYTIEGQGVDLV